MSKLVLTFPKITKSIGGFVIDCFISENYRFTNEVSEIPVEEGSTITDNIYNKPDEITIEGFISNVKYVSYNAITMFKGGIPDRQKRIRTAYKELLRLKQAREPIDLSTGLDVYKNMVITDFDIPRDVETGADLHFTMTFKKLPIIRSETVAISIANVPSTSASNQIQSTAETGIQNKKEEKDNLLKQWYKQEVKNGNVSSSEYQTRWGEPFI